MHEECSREIDIQATLQVLLPAEHLRRSRWQVQGEGVGHLVGPGPRLEGFEVAGRQASLPTEPAIVGVQHQAHWLVPVTADGIVLEALAGVEVEDKQEIAPLERDDFVTLVLDDYVLVLRAEPLEAVLAGHHQLVEGLEVLVAQVVRVRQVPAAAAEVVAPVVLGAREVDPLGVAELVAHEVEVALATKAQHQEAQHLVQRQTAVDAHGGRGRLDQAHACVHLRVHQPEGDGLVADDGLVVRLNVADHLLLIPPVRERVDDVPHVPALVRLLLQHLDEHVRDGHRKAVVEAEAAILHGPAQRGHAADVLANCHCARHDVVDEIVGEHQVDVAVNVSVAAKVLVVVAGVALPDAVRVVQHGRDAVKSEAVKAVLLQPPPHVGQQEAQHLMLRVVEELRVPLRVVPLGAAVRVAVVGAILLRDAV
mmetsp:Transcript_78471/g.202067  ORF Transcript_78471/g.202067 Transcript_78471/m.202067 type:complete len:423 (-) Transcript_78471:401-1669(-)